MCVLPPVWGTLWKQGRDCGWQTVLMTSCHVDATEFRKIGFPVETLPGICHKVFSDHWQVHLLGKWGPPDTVDSR